MPIKLVCTCTCTCTCIMWCLVMSCQAISGYICDVSSSGTVLCMLFSAVWCLVMSCQAMSGYICDVSSSGTVLCMLFSTVWCLVMSCQARLAIYVMYRQVVLCCTCSVFKLCGVLSCHFRLCRVV